MTYCDPSIQSALKALERCTPHQDGFLVGTQCLLPTGDTVRLFVQPTKQNSTNFFVSDYGSAVKSLVDMGYMTNNPHAKRIFASAGKEFGVNFTEDKFYLPVLPADQLVGAFLFVANASALGARKAREKLHILEKPDVRKRLGTYIENRYKDHAHKNASAVGESNKIYRFDYSIDLLSGVADKQLLVDIVKPDANSIYASYVANMDVKKAHYRNYEQCIVYDDETSDTWDSSAIHLLRSAANLVPSSRAKDFLNSTVRH